MRSTVAVEHSLRTKVVLRDSLRQSRPTKVTRKHNAFPRHIGKDDHIGRIADARLCVRGVGGVELDRLAAAASMAVVRKWTDARGWFAHYLLRPV